MSVLRSKGVKRERGGRGEKAWRCQTSGEGVGGEGRSAWRRPAVPVHRLNAGEGHNAEFLNAEIPCPNWDWMSNSWTKNGAECWKVRNAKIPNAELGLTPKSRMPNWTLILLCELWVLLYEENRQHDVHFLKKMFYEEKLAIWLYFLDEMSFGGNQQNDFAFGIRVFC
jgi:hypothetical protein